MARGGREGSDGSDRADAPAADESDEVTELAAELRRLLLVSSRILRSHTASEEVSASQFSVLAFLQRSGTSTPGALADFEHVSPPVMTRMLGRLEEAGLVRRSAHPGDGRQVQVALTDSGEQVVLQGRAERDAWLRRRLQAAGPQERRTLREATALLRRTLVERRD
ncbi:MarR family winged helix-turn-helix transcriptional regulator [Brachybacterium fresconis]|uniref:DNA-binding MarR family transcriptional regulator n=1 Tax=Brachybacterium fresconis TaxID=173363 RepID=A0ABS4YRW2_9MICO|nr:MarR family transcriptional regulator [Brachybacterium fresconis]MBP2411132.1 DNA-binding MarR family transcriptional regulator [Brachybacterium fresconis]